MAYDKSHADPGVLSCKAENGNGGSAIIITDGACVFKVLRHEQGITTIKILKYRFMDMLHRRKRERGYLYISTIVSS
jgi:hypothetical protein